MATVDRRFFVLEGPDGVGKTTIAKKLGERLSAAYVKTPGEGYKDARDYIDNGTSPDAKLFFYLSSVFDASHRIGEALGRQSVVCDRYEWSSLIPHAVYYSTDLGELERTWAASSPGLLRPDKTILVTVDEDEQLARLKSERGDNPSASDKFCMDPRLRRGVRDLYEQIARREGWMTVDSTGRDAGSTAEEILWRLKANGGI